MSCGTPEATLTFAEETPLSENIGIYQSGSLQTSQRASHTHTYPG